MPPAAPNPEQAHPCRPHRPWDLPPYFSAKRTSTPPHRVPKTRGPFVSLPVKKNKKNTETGPFKITPASTHVRRPVAPYGRSMRRAAQRRDLSAIEEAGLHTVHSDHTLPVWGPVMIRRTTDLDMAMAEEASQARHVTEDPVQQPTTRRSGDCWPAAGQPCAPKQQNTALKRDTAARHSCPLQMPARWLVRSPPIQPAISWCIKVAKRCWRSAFDSEKSLRVAAPQTRTHDTPVRTGRNQQGRNIMACICVLLWGGIIPAVVGADIEEISPRICAGQSTARGLQTTSATAGTPASFTIQVPLAKNEQKL